MIELQPGEVISEMDFGYNTRMKGYANLSSDTTELIQNSGHFLTPFIFYVRPECI